MSPYPYISITSTLVLNVDSQMIYSVVQNKLHFKRLHISQTGDKNSINIFLNHNAFVATGEKGNEIIIQMKKWHLFL